MKLSPKYNEDHWKAAFDGGENWDKAIDIVENRIRGRWLTWADKIAPETYSGFALLTLDCILLESLWGFMNGKAFPKGLEKQAYNDMLKGGHFSWSETEIDSFRKFVRNGLMHDAETRNQWFVQQTVPKNSLIEKRLGGGYTINRTKFHEAVKATFEDWVAQLRTGDATLHDKMRDRMNQIIKAHYAF
jgi:hypothetical protein